ncbi:acyl-CoA thioesterase [Aquibacillus sediminis]|uniref:acyl-CoA thioesterase n=1 Tax=Aquibacillus sediminis TaxID=2574734 RepID=UPI001FECA359|nr:thioesterase family protein [Aquibacillus sediminis]
MKKVNYVINQDRWLQGFTFYSCINPRFSETDMFGHVNNTVMFVYFEQARIEFLQHLGLFTSATKDKGVVPVVADLQCDYHKPLFFNDQLNLYVKVNEIGKTSFDLHYLGITNKEEICVTGRGRMVQVDSTSGKPVPFTDTMLKQLHNV